MTQDEESPLAALGGLKAGWLVQAEVDLTEIATVIAAMANPNAIMPALSKQLYGVAHNIKGQAGTFGYLLMSDIAGKLCVYLRERGAALAATDGPLLRAHHASLSFVLSKRLEGDGGPAGRAILEKLAGLAGTR